jgi:hypothetical protein
MSYIVSYIEDRRGKMVGVGVIEVLKLNCRIV